MARLDGVQSDELARLFKDVRDPSPPPDCITNATRLLVAWLRRRCSKVVRPMASTNRQLRRWLEAVKMTPTSVAWCVLYEHACGLANNHHSSAPSTRRGRRLARQRGVSSSMLAVVSLLCQMPQPTWMIKPRRRSLMILAFLAERTYTAKYLYVRESGGMYVVGWQYFLDLH